MSSLSSFKNPAAYHLLSYGTLLGSTLFQSFIAGVVAYKTLPRAQFSSLQKATFPIYFTLQTALPILMALTYPSSTSTSTSRSSYSTLLPSSTQSSADRLSFWLIATMLGTAVVNLVYVGPQTTKVMVERKHQETRDGKKYDDKEKSEAMKALNRQFGVLHGVSSSVNLVGLGGMVWYGVLMAEGLRI